MKNISSTKSVRAIHFREILDSHVGFTTEFVLELEDGTVGVGSTPRGETLSVYEKTGRSRTPQKAVDTMISDEVLNRPLNQAEFDTYLKKHVKNLGKKNCFALSLAFYDAVERSSTQLQKDGNIGRKKILPYICLNVLNGGRFAYTNPILSDFPEFLLVARSNLLEDVIYEHEQLQKRIKEKLLKCHKLIVNGNLVNSFDIKDNRACLDFLVEALDELGLASKYDLMLDASAGDLWTGSSYRLSLTDDSVKTSSEMCDYWIDLIDTYNIKFLEDPFHEKDFKSWKKLSHAQRKCKVISDNLYCSDPLKIQEGASKEYTHGTIVKPDQAGTVSSTIEAINVAKQMNQIIITSHRSISTESTFLSAVTSKYDVDYIKIGPLTTDYSAIIRLNELIRLSGIGYE